MVPKTENTLNVSPIDAPIAFHSDDKSKLQPFVETLCDLIDVIDENETCIPVLLTEIEYQQLAARLDALIDIVGEESHPLAPLLHFVGTLIKNYEDEHVPRLTEL
jgi:hypothetical protein